MGLFGRKKKEEKTIGIVLKVAEAYTRDVGKGVARIDYDTMDALNASSGDVIEIKGLRTTVAKCLPLYPNDEGKGIIKIDEVVRDNSRMMVGNTITVRKTGVTAAEKVLVEALEKKSEITGPIVTDNLEGIPVIEGDKIIISFSHESHEYQITEVIPSEKVVLITKKTEFYIQPLEEEWPTKKDFTRWTLVLQKKRHFWKPRKNLKKIRKSVMFFLTTMNAQFLW